MDKKTFDFYHVVKNEDAYTYSYEQENWGFIVAADGLGGSGSTLHVLNDEQKKNLESLLKAAALPEYFRAAAPTAKTCEDETDENDDSDGDAVQDTVEETIEDTVEDTVEDTIEDTIEETIEETTEETPAEASAE